MVEEETLITYDNVEYRIKAIEQRTVGQTPVKIVTAPHVFFDLVDEYRYGALSTGEKSINEIMSYIFTDTGWTFSVIDPFDVVNFEEFGNDNCLALFETAINAFQAEFELNGSDVIIRTKIGSTIDLQFRYNHNIKTFKKSIDTSNLSTYIKGYGQKLEDPYIFDSGQNYASRTGTWSDTIDPYHVTSQVGATFVKTFTGTKIAVRYMVANDGGVWEFVIDGSKKKKVSTWSKKSGVLTTVLFDGLAEGSHTITATFKGDDSNHTPSTGKGTAKGYICHDTTLKTFDVYRTRVGDEVYATVAEYTSPNASKYPKVKHAPPYQSDTATTQAALLKELKKRIVEVPEVTIELEFVILKDAGYIGEPGIGDIVPTVYEPLDIDLDMRVMDIEEYPESPKSPKVTLSTSVKSFANSVMNYQKKILDEIYDANSKKLRYNVYDEAVKRATEALNNSLTELEYPAGMGIVARDPVDPSRFVAVRSAGIGVTTDGGESFGNAITADGVTTNLLTAGQIKTNNIQIIGNDDLFYWDGNYLIAINASNPNKFVRLNSNGLYIAKGSMTIERPDGALFMQDGMMRNDFSVDSHYPQFKNDNDVTIVDYWCRTPRDSYVDINYYSLYHNARYLKILVGLKGQSGNHAYFRLAEEGGGAEIETYEYQYENGPGYFKTLTLDLGIPTYTRRYFYAQLKSLDPSRYAFGRILRIWMEG